MIFIVIIGWCIQYIKKHCINCSNSEDNSIIQNLIIFQLNDSFLQLGRQRVLHRVSVPACDPPACDPPACDPPVLTSRWNRTIPKSTGCPLHCRKTSSTHSIENIRFTTRRVIEHGFSQWTWVVTSKNWDWIPIIFSYNQPLISTIVDGKNEATKMKPTCDKTYQIFWDLRHQLRYSDSLPDAMAMLVFTITIEMKWWTSWN